MDKNYRDEKLIQEYNVHNLYALRDHSQNQVTGLFLYKSDEEAIMHMEYALRELFLEEEKDEKKYLNAQNTDLILVAEMDLSTAMTAGKTNKKIFSGRKFLDKLELQKIKEDKKNENNENKE